MRNVGGVETASIVLHANWSEGKLHLWAEGSSGHDIAAPPEDGPAMHPGAAPADVIAERLEGLLPTHRADRIVVRLPSMAGVPLASPEMRLERGVHAHESGDDSGGEAVLREWSLETLAFEPSQVPVVLDLLQELGEALGEGDRSGDLASEAGVPGVVLGSSVAYFAAGSRLARSLLVQQRFVPALRQDGANGELTGVWHPWLADGPTASRVAALVGSMPPAARAVDDGHAHDAWTVTEDFLGSLIDAACRRTLLHEEMTDTIDGQNPAQDMQVAWLSGLLGAGFAVPGSVATRSDLVRGVRRWIAGLEDRGESAVWRLGLRLNEPVSESLGENIESPGDDVSWSVSFFLESQDNPEIRVEAADIWLLSRETVNMEGVLLEGPQELLLAELGRASRYYKRIEDALDDQEPIEVLLETKEAYRFLREIKPVLVEQGFAVETPAWWESPAGRLGARLRIESDPLESLVDHARGSTTATGTTVGLNALVGYQWEIAVGDTTLTLHEFEKYAQSSSPLVRIGGKWVEIRPEDVTNAVKFIQENPGGEMPLVEALRLAYSSDVKKTGVPVLGLDAGGWVAEMFGGGGDRASVSLPQLETPESFKGTLRPYQQRGLSWLSFMEQFGFGACLADDMGLGKTVQLLALVSHEREKAKKEGTGQVLPTLLVVPMSVVGNWEKEAKRFTPHLKVLIHHGVERHQGEAFERVAKTHDIIITTYALANRDRELFEAMSWARVVLDEAQFIKNPQAKQSQAVRALAIDKRIALTGTPVENRLSELWSIMDFLNPGYLGPAGQFRKRFALPIERYRDQRKGDQLRSLVQPFILRRVKTDPTVVADLPEKLESKEFCHLTSEQAELYERCVKRMLTDVEQSEGIHRRGLVLATLIKLKQICNHPAQMLKETDPQAGGVVDPRRSGKCVRLLEMLDEVLAEGDQSLIFTQFRQMGHILSGMLRHELGREVLFLHGGTPQGQRQKLIDQFQEQTGKTPILILSLKAGGVGLNLTAATHVFHFDRWWNPAVENQATDRAYRIGQTRTVQVHKFVVRGTLEERIDEMIESKTELAENIIGHGERWLTELDTGQLRELLTLRADAVGDES